MDPKLATLIAEGRSKAPSKEDLADIAALIKKARACELEKQDLEARLETVNKSIQEYHRELLPDAFLEAGIESFTIAASGNHPAVEAQMKPFYAAGIAANWSETKRQEAFDYLKSVGAEDLIKTEVLVRFGRQERAAAEALIKRLSSEGLTVMSREAVHHGTLTSWLKEQVERFQKVPNLEKIGGIVGRIVKLKNKE